MDITNAFSYRLLEIVLRVWSTPIFGIRLKDGQFSVHLLPEIPPSKTIDERIAKLDSAKANLSEAIGAIDELQSEARRHKEEIGVLSSQLAHASQEKERLEQQVSATRVMSEIDAEAFRQVTGLPTRKQIAWERLVGFVLGVIASITASGLWWLGSTLLSSGGG